MTITQADIVLIMSNAGALALRLWPAFNKTDDCAELLADLQDEMIKIVNVRYPEDKIESLACHILALHTLGCLVGQERMKREAALQPKIVEP